MQGLKVDIGVFPQLFSKFIQYLDFLKVIYLFVCMYVCTRAYHSTCEEQLAEISSFLPRIKLRSLGMLPSAVPAAPSLVLRHSLYLPRAYHSSASQPAVHLPCSNWLHHTSLCPAFYVGSGDPNSCPHSCTVGTFLTAIFIVTEFHNHISHNDCSPAALLAFPAAKLS